MAKFIHGDSIVQTHIYIWLFNNGPIINIIRILYLSYDNIHCIRLIVKFKMKTKLKHSFNRYKCLL